MFSIIRKGGGEGCLECLECLIRSIHCLLEAAMQQFWCLVHPPLLVNDLGQFEHLNEFSSMISCISLVRTTCSVRIIPIGDYDLLLLLCLTLASSASYPAKIGLCIVFTITPIGSCMNLVGLLIYSASRVSSSLPT